MKKRFATLLVCWSVPAVVLAQSAPALKSGEQVDREPCLASHGPGANSGGKWQDPDARLLERIRSEEAKRIEQLKKPPVKG